MISTKVLAVFLGVLIAGAGLSFLAGRMTAPATTASALQGTIPIGVVHADSVEGLLYDDGMNYALPRINKWLNESGIPVQIVLYTEQAEQSGTKAVEVTQSLMNRGCQVIIQGEWSSQLKACMSLFNDRKIVDIAPGSQSDELAIAGDYIFRLPPPSSRYAPAHKATLLEFGTKAVIMIYTMETFGQGLYEAIRAQCESAGINVSYAIGVDPVGHDFAAEIGAVVPYYDSAVAVYGKENVTIEISGADPPTVDLIASIASYPQLHDARLLIHDAYATGLLDRAAVTGAKMRTIGYLLTPPQSPLTKEFHDYIKTTKGYEAYAYAYTANDCLWIAVLSMLAAGKYNGEAIAKVLPQVANSFYGLSGWTKLNAAGDREYGTFTISQVQTLQNGTAIWKDLGIYDGTSDTITWSSRPL